MYFLIGLFALLALSSQLTILGPGAISPADPGVLERVAERRLRNGWGLTDVNLQDYNALVAPADCDLLGRRGWLVAGKRVVSALVVDCEADVHRGQMDERGLLLDTNRQDLAHLEGLLILRKK